MAQELLPSDHLMDQEDDDELTIVSLSQLFDDEDDQDHLHGDHPVQILPTTLSDAKISEELQLQETLMSSLLAAHNSQLIKPMLITTTTTTMLKDKQVLEVGESSSSSPSLQWSEYYLCEICTEKKQAEEMFNKYKSCPYSFCSDCIGKHIASKVADQYRSSLKAVSCPGLDCAGVHVLDLEACSQILPKEVVEKWDEALCEWIILGSRNFYCPFRDCSAVFLIDGREEEEGEVVRQSECPMCHRLFCAWCYVPWHSGVDCEEFQRLNEDERGSEDLMVKDLAKEKEWKRCPHCKFYVERTQGCLHITCRCNFQFCYGCGSEWTQTHGPDCQRN